MNLSNKAALVLVLGAIAGGCSRDESSADSSAGSASTGDFQVTDPLDIARAELDAEDMKRYIGHLASDEFEGRAPFSIGEQKTLTYLEDRFAALGLVPGGDKANGFRQPVDLVEITLDPQVELTASRGDGTPTKQLAYGEDVVLWTKRVREQVALVDSEVVFVGFGIVAPEYDWNDYAGVDVTGKTVVMLVNDPGYHTEDESLFNGNAMTYYGRWTYKFDEAARQGAAAALIIHETGAAGYGWDVVKGSWTGPQFDLATPDGNATRVQVEGWISRTAAQQMLADAGQDLDQLEAGAVARSSSPVALATRVGAQLENTIRESQSFNVLAKLEGRTRPDEIFVYMAHWDHLGVDPTLEGDQIYNGAVDNATGVAALLELAEAFAALPERPERTVLFLAVTAEESGLLGSAFYAENPVYPLSKTVAGINIDAMNVSGPTNDVVVVGFGSSEMEDYLREAAEVQNRVVTREPTPEKGYFYRSDHFNFAKKGVPVLYAEAGVDDREHGSEYGLAQQKDYVAYRYHKPGDEMLDSWNMAGIVEDLNLYFSIGHKIANSSAMPQWYEGSEFKAARDASLAPSDG